MVRNVLHSQIVTFIMQSGETGSGGKRIVK